MTLKGIDISSWQADLDIDSIASYIDFCIVKATEGTTYVSQSCDKHVQQCIKKKLKWGFYHFAGGGNPEKEAEFFHRSCNGYIGIGIPVLDYEIRTTNDKEWCERFISHFYTLAKVYPMLYISASRCSDYIGSWIPDKCGLWLAGYPQQYSTWSNDEMPYSISPWKICAIWQFTSTLHIPGYAGNLDGNIAYMDRTAWNKYAKRTTSYVQPTLSYDSLAQEIIAGNWSNGSERKKLLTNAGYDYDTAQQRVMQYYERAAECTQGLWGNGWNRENALTSMGYDYKTVQMIVNDLMGLK